jgi:hypothetical protein
MHSTPPQKASFESLTEARNAIDLLERAGVDAAEVSLLGPGKEEAAHAQSTGRRDRAVAADTFAHVGVGALLGAGLGAAAGAVGAAVMDAGAWAFVVGALVAGASLGGMIGGVAKLDMHPDWELTYQDVHDGRTLVTVHAGDPDQLRRMTELLERAQPRRISTTSAPGPADFSAAPPNS